MCYVYLRCKDLCEYTNILRLRSIRFDSNYPKPMRLLQDNPPKLVQLQVALHTGTQALHHNTNKDHQYRCVSQRRRKHSLNSTNEHNHT